MTAKKQTELVLTPPEAEVSRSTGIGGTDVSAIVGLNPYKSPFSVWADKLGLLDREENAAMRWGTILEPQVLAEYATQEGVAVVPPTSKTLRHPERSWQVGSPDGLVPPRRRVVDAKTAGLWQEKRWGEPGTDQIPDEYLCQVAWYMSLLDYDEADIPVLIGGQDFRIYHVARDRELEAMLLEAAEHFWRTYVMPNEPPPISADEGAAQYLRKRYPRERLPLRQANQAEADLVTELAGLRAQRDQLERLVTERENAVKMLIGESAGIEGPGFRITYKAVNTNRTDWKAVVTEMSTQIQLLLSALPTSAKEWRDVLTEALKAKDRYAKTTETRPFRLLLEGEKP